MALETGDRAWPFTWGMLLTPMRKAGGLGVKILCPNFSIKQFHGVPIIPLLSNLLEHENVGTCARRSTGQPTPKKRPRDETQALSCNSCRDSSTALQHRLWKSNASLRPKMSIWKAQGRERPGALGSSMYDDGWFWRDESVFLFPPLHGCIYLSWGRVQQQKWCVGNLWRQGPPKRRQTLLGTQLVVDDSSQMFFSLAFSQIFESFLEPAMKDLVPSCRHNLDLSQAGLRRKGVAVFDPRGFGAPSGSRSSRGSAERSSASGSASCGRKERWDRRLRADREIRGIHPVAWPLRSWKSSIHLPLERFGHDLCVFPVSAVRWNCANVLMNGGETGH